MTRRVISFCAALLVVSVVSTAPAVAARRDFTGTVTASFNFHIGPSCPGNAHIESVSGTLIRPQRPKWSFKVPALCVSALGHEAEFSGRATIIPPGGGVIHARLTGLWQQVEGTTTAQIWFRISGGTDQFVHATGTVTSGWGNLDLDTGKFTAPMTGTVTT